MRQTYRLRVNPWFVLRPVCWIKGHIKRDVQGLHVTDASGIYCERCMRWVEDRWEMEVYKGFAISRCKQTWRDDIKVGQIHPIYERKVRELDAREDQGSVQP